MRLRQVLQCSARAFGQHQAVQALLEVPRGSRGRAFQGEALDGILREVVESATEHLWHRFVTVGKGGEVVGCFALKL